MRERAIELLQFYFAVAMDKRSAFELQRDQRMEIADIVDCILIAAREPSTRMPPAEE